MVHLSKIALFNSRISMKKRSFITSTEKITFKSPDLLAINSLKSDTYSVFESKGYGEYNPRAMERGDTEYYGAAEPPVRCGESHLSGLTEPPIDSYSA